MDCKRCGKCCQRMIIALHNVPINNDKQELGRWLSYHGVETTKIFNGKEDVLAIKFNKLCKFAETKDGLFYSCKIYKNRPQICRDYWCSENNLQALMDKIAEELLRRENVSNFNKTDNRN